MDEPDFGRWLQSWRHTQRMTQRELADALGYDVTYVAKLERGGRPPTRQLLTRLAQVAGGPVDALVPAPVADVARVPLPLPHGPLIGRDGQVADLLDLFDEGARCVTLVGPPGIGKTRLALELAGRMSSRLPGGAAWVSLREVSSVDSVARRVQQAFGLGMAGAEGPDGNADAVDVLCGFLRRQQALVVLDNFEHLLGGRAVVDRLLAGTLHLAVLVTSREPLGIESEHVRVVPPLALPTGDDLASLPAVQASPAVELFVSRARMARADFRLTEDNRAHVADACRRLDGIPLAIVLAAGALRTTDAAHVAAGVGLRAARSRRDDDAGHLRTLDEAIASSWEPLSPEEKRLFAALSVCAGGCTTTAAAALGGIDDDLAAWDLLDRLVRKSLVEARPDAPGGPRYELLETMRAFAADRLEESGLTGEVRARHVAFFAERAEELGQALTGRDQRGSLAALEADYPNLADAFEWALASDPHVALGLAGALWRFFLIHDIPVGQRWLELALAACPHPSPERARALVGAGALAWVTGRFESSSDLLGEGLELAERLGRRDMAALAELNRGALAEQLGHLDDADEAFTRALAACDPGDARTRGTALMGQGVISRRRGDLETAAGLWQTAARLFADAGDLFNQAIALSNLALAAEAEDHLDEAQEWRAECRRLQRAVGDVRGLAITTASLGRIAFRRGRFDEARTCHFQALDAFRRLGDVRRAAGALLYLAAVAGEQGRHHRAVRLVGAVDALWEQLGTEPDDDGRLRKEIVAAAEPFLGTGLPRAVAAGRMMTLDAATELAFDADEARPGTPSPASPSS